MLVGKHKHGMRQVEMSARCKAIAWLIAGLMAPGLAVAEETFDLAKFRSLAASDRSAGIEQGRQALDSGRFRDDPVTERQVLWYMGGAAIGMPDDLTLGEVVLRLNSLGELHRDDIALAYADFLRGARDIELDHAGQGLAVVLRGANRIALNDDPNIRATASSELCKAFNSAARLEQALEYCHRHTEAVRGFNDPAQLARAEYLEASTLSQLGRHSESVPLWESARRRFLEIDLPVLAARAAGSLAMDLLDLERVEEALPLALEAKRVGEEAGNPISAYMAQQSIAQALFALGRLDEAHREIDAAIAGTRPLGLPDLMLTMLELKEQLALASGHVEQAQAAAKERGALQAEPAPAALNITIDALEQRYLAREQALRIRELEQENTAKANALERSRIEADLRESALRAQRTTLWLIALVCVALAVALVSIALLLRSQRKLAENLRRHAREDALTGVGNRRALFEAIQATLASGRHNHALILIDVDHFKQLNDTGGHPFGDAVLRSVAHALRASAPPQAVVYRHGGEEFALLYEDCDESRTLALAEKLRNAVRELEFALDGDGQAVRITISLGVCLLSNSPAPEASTWVQAADRALYAAKRDGRDRVALVESPSPA